MAKSNSRLFRWKLEHLAPGESFFALASNPISVYVAGSRSKGINVKEFTFNKCLVLFEDGDHFQATMVTRKPAGEKLKSIKKSVIEAEIAGMEDGDQMLVASKDLLKIPNAQMKCKIITCSLVVIDGVLIDHG